VTLWDAKSRKRIAPIPPYNTSISSLSFNHKGDRMAIAVSYTWEEGEKEHPKEQIYVRNIPLKEKEKEKDKEK
jgi:cell cycle arrest protein BUB3